jgi:hypothetical protein
MRELLQGLRTAMALKDQEEPTPEGVQEVSRVAKELLDIAQK